MAMPSLATTVSCPGVLKRFRSVPFSSSFMGREALATSVVPLMRAEMPVPLPPPVTWTFLPGFFFMYPSAQRWARITMVSEPFTITAAVARDGATSRAIVSIALLMSAFLLAAPAGAPSSYQGGVGVAGVPRGRTHPGRRGPGAWRMGNARAWRGRGGAVTIARRTGAPAGAPAGDVTRRRAG